jgi:glycosyltransferase involved in cell wall biosynthesis
MQNSTIHIDPSLDATANPAAGKKTTARTNQGTSQGTNQGTSQGTSQGTTPESTPATATIAKPNHPGKAATVAVLIPFHYKENLDLLQQSINSIHQQKTSHTIRIYLGIDGPIHQPTDNHDRNITKDHTPPTTHSSPTPKHTEKLPSSQTKQNISPGSPIQHFLNENHSKIHRVVHNPVNQGLAVILNRMIDALDDELFIARLDADDLALPDRIEKQINFMLNHPDIDVCGGAIIETDMQPGGYRQTISYPLTHQAIAQSWYKRNAIAHPACCIRKGVFEAGYRYPTDALYNEDLGMWLMLMQAGRKFANLEDPLIEFRITHNFYSRRGYVMAIVEFKLYTQAIRHLTYPLHAYLYPFARFLFRLTPPFIKKMGYRSGLRRLL